MSSLEVVDSYTNKRVKCFNNIFTVYEDREYSISYNSDVINEGIVFIEDMPINFKYIKSDQHKILIESHRIFDGNFGLADLIVNNERFSFNIRTNKLNAKEIEDIISYLFLNNHLLINTFVSSNKSAIEKNQSYDEVLPFSSKYVIFLNNICQIFEEQYTHFVRMPYTVIRQKESIISYERKAGNYKIDWLFNNLDEIVFDDQFELIPNSLKIGDEYGWIDKIAADENQISYNTYENRILLGSIIYFMKILKDAQRKIDQKLRSNMIGQEDEKESDSVDFTEMRLLPYLKLKDDLIKIETRILRINKRYSSLFKDTPPLIQYPRLTSVFSSYKHYQKIFIEIKSLYETKYSMEGEMNLLSIKKLNKLYELFNLCILVEGLDGYFKIKSAQREVIGDSTIIKEVRYSNKSIELNLYYEPIITKESLKTDLVVIGNYQNVSNKMYRPDYVIECKCNNVVSYCILDAKYSKSSTVKQYHLTNCTKKYLIDIGVYNNRYKKADFLIILNPDQKDDNIKVDVTSDYSPQIGSICVKPNHLRELNDFLYSFIDSSIQNWIN